MELRSTIHLRVLMYLMTGGGTHFKHFIGRLTMQRDGS